jgi:3-methyladenine DNA glycosylase AlkD
MADIMTAEGLKSELQRYANAEDAAFLQRFFKTGEGQYGAGDQFIGVRVPDTRKACKSAGKMPLSEVEELLKSDVHEHRLAAVILLADQFKSVASSGQEDIYRLYLKALDRGYINNWDIVDTSAEFIVGEYLWERSRESLLELARHQDVWHRRVAVLASFQFIKKGDASTTLELAKVLLHDSHDLIQKAVGWMLREVGKRVSRELLITFLEEHHKDMPRTMLRYAIEHLEPSQRAHFMERV